VLVLGIVLILIAALAFVTAVAGGANDHVDFRLGSMHAPTNAMVVFLLGAATLLIFVMGLELVRSGTGRAIRRRKDAKRLDRLSGEQEEREAQTRPPTSTDDDRE
jgi:hypothetical protein